MSHFDDHQNQDRQQQLQQQLQAQMRSGRRATARVAAQDTNNEASRSLVVFGAVLAAIALIWAVMFASTSAHAQSSDDDTVIAEINGTKMYRSQAEDVFESLNEETQAVGFEEIYPRLLESLIQQEVILDAAMAAGFKDDPGFRAQMAKVEAQVMRDMYLRKLVDERLTDDAMRETYDSWLSRNPPQEEVKARHVLVETEEKARELIAELQQGASFADMAREHSVGPSAAQGGDLGFFPRGRMVPTFDEAAFALEAGAYTVDPVQTQFGWHIILVEEKRATEPPSFDSVKEQMKQQMTEQMAFGVAAELTAEAEVSRFGLDGAPIEAPN